MYKYHKKTPEERHKEIDELSRRLEEGTIEYLESDRYKEILDTFAKFHRYSFNNSILIMLQKPEASHVASYTSWKNDFNRQVAKGEKGIAILCPMPRKIREERQKLDPLTKQPIYKADGTPETEVEEYTVTSGYKIGYTFDVSQTQPIDNGKNTPDLEVVHDLQGNVSGYEDLKKAIIASAPVPIEFADFDGNARGYFSPQENKIVIRDGMSEEQTIKTMIHETTHSMLHNLDRQKERKDNGLSPLSAADREIQAESTAYVVASHYGIDTSEYSFPYVGTWAGDKNLIKGNLQTIKEASGQLIDKIDRQLELQQEAKMKTENLVKSTETHDIRKDADSLAQNLSDFYKETDPDAYEKKEQLYKGAVKDMMYQYVRHDRAKRIKGWLDNIANRDDSKTAYKAEELSLQISKYRNDYKEQLEEEKTRTRSRGR